MQVSMLVLSAILGVGAVTAAATYGLEDSPPPIIYANFADGWDVVPNGYKPVVLGIEEARRTEVDGLVEIDCVIAFGFEPLQPGESIPYEFDTPMMMWVPEWRQLVQIGDIIDSVADDECRFLD